MVLLPSVGGCLPGQRAAGIPLRAKLSSTPFQPLAWLAREVSSSRPACSIVDGRAAGRLLLERDRDLALVAGVGAGPLPRPAVDEPVGTRDLAVGAADDHRPRRPVCASRGGSRRRRARPPRSSPRAPGPPSTSAASPRGWSRRRRPPRPAPRRCAPRARCRCRRRSRSCSVLLVCSFRNSSTTSSLRSHSARCLASHAYASSSERRCRRRRCVRPSITRTIAPASSSTFRCLLIAGLETGKSCVASPTVSSPLGEPLEDRAPQRVGDGDERAVERRG